MGIRIGVDLGATYAKMAYVDEHGDVVTLCNAEGSYATPSVVCFGEPSHVVVGDIAKECAIIDPEHTVSKVKHLIGKCPCAINYNGNEVSPEEVVALILRKMVQDASMYLESEIEDAVITVPPHFGMAERTAIKNAALIANIKPLGIISESTAATISYGLHQTKEERVVLVYDLGGASFDLHVVRINSSQIETVCSDGIDHLGGADWDEALVRYLIDEFEKETGCEYDIHSDPYALQDILLKAEKAKMQLSARNEVPVMLSVADTKARVRISRDVFEDITAHLLQATIDKTDEVLHLAESKGYTVDEILLVGGGALMPQVGKALRDKFAIEPTVLDPHTAIAKGAAMYAMIDHSPESEPVCTKSYDFKVLQDGKEMCRNFIAENTPLPRGGLVVTNELGIVNSGDGIITLAIYERAPFNGCCCVGPDLIVGTLQFRVPQNRAFCAIKVKLILSSDGVLEVNCIDKETGWELTNARFGTCS